jgi:hypothetical protein
MTTDRKREIIATIVFVLLCAVFVAGWVREHDLRVHAEADSAADKKVADAAAVSIKTRDAAQVQVDADAVKQAAAVQTPQQAVEVIEHYLPAPVAVAGQPAASQSSIPVVATKDLPAAMQSQVPNAPTVALLTGDQVEQIAKDQIACAATTSDLGVCKADFADQVTQTNAYKASSASWEAAAKGGSKFKRFLTVAKYTGCAFVGGFAGSKLSPQNSGKASAIGAGTGVVACSLLP